MITPNTQAILLLTAPLIAGRGEIMSDPLTHGEYNRLASILRNIERSPSDLLTSDSGEVIEHCQGAVDGARLKRLLGRGFLLSQSLDRWQSRGIWIVSREDIEYPARFTMRLKEYAPPILYGCGDRTILDSGGLAVVGSRNVDDSLLEYAEKTGRLAAEAHCVIISGGARGIDQAAMRGALEEGGCVSGVLSDNLERAVLASEHREAMMDSRLVLISPFDPAAGFHVGQAMQRNKLIYALSDAALVVSSEYEKGGTWAGAVEQLRKFHLIPVYVRSDGETGKGLAALRNMGALPWGNPDAPEELQKILAFSETKKDGVPEQFDITRQEDELADKLKKLLSSANAPMKEEEIVSEIQIPKSEVRRMLKRLVNEGILLKMSRPVKYMVASKAQTDFIDG